MPYKDSEKQREWNRKWREAHPDYAKSYYRDNQEYLQMLSRQRQPKPPTLPRPEKLSKSKIYREAKDKPCADCGKRFPACAMDFDHVRGIKLFDVSSKLGTPEELIAEIAKCDVICSNCHRVRTTKRKGKRKTHRVPIIEMRKRFIEQSKNVPCMDCGGKFHVFAMEFFHVRGKRLFGLYEGCYKDTNLIVAEMAKCDILCSNCARVRAQARRKKKSPRQ